MAKPIKDSMGSGFEKVVKALKDKDLSDEELVQRQIYQKIK